MNDNMAELIRLAKCGRRAERTSKLLAVMVEGLVTSVLAALWRGFFLMLGIGIVHDVWIPAVPTLGYWNSVLLFIVLDVVFDLVHGSKKAAKS